MLDGTWHVIATNFPMWTTGKKQKPRFVYSNVQTVDGRMRMDDTVLYEEGGKEKRYVGVDTQDRGSTTCFTWRGRGWLFPLTSHWEIIWRAVDEEVLALRFTRTLFTPEGIDIIARASTLSDARYAEVLKALDSPALTRL